MTTKDPRRLAVDLLDRIEDGAFANLVVPSALDRSGLAERDRHFVTDLVYGTTRMRRACDHVVDRFLERPVEPTIRSLLRLGAYQLVFLQTPPHAAVSATVAAAPKRAAGLVNAVLRKVAADPRPAWPDDATRLSYPDWIVDRLVVDLGRDLAVAALEQMNAPAVARRRDDGYVQDVASEDVARFVASEPGDVVADLCAGPGGKATFLGHTGAAVVVAADSQPHRARLVADNAATTGTSATVATVVADARRPPTRPDSFDRVLLDAPCSGLGVLRRRPDARWRVAAGDVDQLAHLQRELLAAAVDLVRPGGTLTYSVCTLTTAETTAIDEWLAAAHPELEPVPPPPAPWEPAGRGARLLPQAKGSDGMYVLGLRKARR